MPRPIVFLHLPKTAGQSIRHFLTDSFPSRALFPGQVNAHLALYSESDLKQYSIFSGHFSWSLMEFLGRDALYFTVLREPAARVISFYKFLRRQAEALSPEQRRLPQNAVIAYALEKSLEDFLSAADPAVRPFLLNHFDNFYMYYFATRTIDGRGLVRDTYPESDHFVSEQVLNVAIRNMKDNLRVYDTVNLDRVIADMRSEEGFKEAAIPFLNVDRNSEKAGEDDITKFSSNAALAREQIHIKCHFDARIYRTFANL